MNGSYPRLRQARLLAVLRERGLDAVVLGDRIDVQYFTGFRQSWQHQAAAMLFSDGTCWLCTPNSPAKDAEADEVTSFEANWAGTLRQEQAAVLAGKIAERLRASANGKRMRVGTDASAVSTHYERVIPDDETQSIDADVWQLRRAKDDDELAIMRVAIEACGTMYVKAREIIRPGLSELDMFAELQKVAVESMGEPMGVPLGNDYTCGGGGGWPRKDRVAAAGEIWLLDLGPNYRGYFADTCRAICVGGKPTDEQLAAHKSVMEALAIVEREARAGVKCRDLYAMADEHFKTTRGTGMPHHLGHGVGLSPHEYPHLNPKWDDVLIEGEIFSAEPAQYGDVLKSGIRIENTYRVTKTGVEKLTAFETGL